MIVLAAPDEFALAGLLEHARRAELAAVPFHEADLLQQIGRCLGIRYLLEGEPTASGPPVPDGTTAAAIPPPLREALRTAVVNGDLEAMLALADELARVDPAGARVVRDLAERFEYGRLAAYLAEEC